eukprot:3109968-Amphidinium_carterae.1
MGALGRQIITLLNRIIELKTDGGKRWIQYEPDPRHVQIARADLGLDKCMLVSTPGSRGLRLFQDVQIKLKLLRVYQTNYAEFVAMVWGASIVLGAAGMAKDLELAVGLTLATYSSTSSSCIKARGVAKIRHLHTPLLATVQKRRSRDLDQGSRQRQ